MNLVRDVQEVLSTFGYKHFAIIWPTRVLVVFESHVRVISYAESCSAPQVQTLILAPIAPHTMEEFWTLLGGTGTVLKAGWPSAAKPNFLLLREDKYLQDLIESLRKVRHASL